jgi:hypothetical protein
MSIHPCDSLAVQEQLDPVLTAIVPLPPELLKLAERGVTVKLQLDPGPGAGDGVG